MTEENTSLNLMVEAIAVTFNRVWIPIGLYDKLKAIFDEALKQEKAQEVGILKKALERVASNDGRGSIHTSAENHPSHHLRVIASEALKEAGYNYYECVGKDNRDGWFKKEELPLN